ncbi:MAG TPA: hypothetical protein ENN05_01340 [Deltaproteobacteria bacterium]|nr:hypothetical protein [Deltaproteobacteria bacterium]
MKKLYLIVILLLFWSSFGWTYHIEVLQISNISAYDETYDGFIEELAKNGIEQEENLTINRHIIDADAEAGLWKKVGILLKIKTTTSKIVDARPDLVLTVSTPGTKYSMNKLIGAGIPVVFTCVANPPLLGCPSVAEPIVGITGATLYIDPFTLMAIVQTVKPDIKKIGIIHSDDDNAVAFADESRIKATRLGISIITKQLEKSDDIKPAALELINNGIEAFAIPLDQYYGLRNLEPAIDIIAVASEHKIPIFSFANFDQKGALVYVGSEFKHNGILAARQAVKILKEGAKPEDLPILKQEELNISVDLGVASELGIDIPQHMLDAAKKL